MAGYKEEIESREQPTQPEPYFPERQVDVSQMQATRDASTRQGSTVVDSTVMSVYDARPINGYDFVYNVPGTLVLDADEISYIGAFVNYQVPFGYRAVLRSFSYELGIITNVAGASPLDIITTVFVGGGGLVDDTNGNIVSNSAAQPGFSNVGFGQVFTQPQQCFILADAGDYISIQVLFDSSYNDLDQTINFYLYGNLMLNTGVSLPYEVGFKGPVPVANDAGYKERQYKELVVESQSMRRTEQDNIPSQVLPSAVVNPTRHQPHTRRPVNRRK